MELNITTLLYLFFRLSPFIIVSYFSLGSIFNQDMKGLIYLVGLLLSISTTILIGNSVPVDFTVGIDEATGVAQIPPPICNLITIGNNGSFSNIPIGTSMLTYTLIYLVYIIAINKLEKANIPTLVLLPALILADIIWNASHRCYALSGIIISIICGGLIGWFWAATVHSFNKPELFFLNVGGDRPVCHRPSKQLFKCTFPKETQTENDEDDQ